MDWSFLSLLAEPWFVISWYTLGALGAWYVIYDFRNHNTPLKPAMKWAWPIIIFFFSIIGIILYFATGRAPNISSVKDEKEKNKLHQEYEKNSWRRVNGAVIHCVAGDGLGIMTGMVIARTAGMSFWEEFWFEYLVGYLVGWTIFQRKSMTMMTDNLAKQLAMSFRAEFFSMLTVMGGMGAVMTYITPMVVTSQPKPLTFAFWGFGMLGLLVGFILTYPMNWMLLKIGWKHGMGDMESAEKKQVHTPGKKSALASAMVVAGLIGLLIPAWLTHLREEASTQGQMLQTPVLGNAQLGSEIHHGFTHTLKQALEHLQNNRRTEAVVAIDEAHRIAQVGAHSAPGSFYSAYEQVESARLALHQGRERKAFDHLSKALRVSSPAQRPQPPILRPEEFAGAKVIDQYGAFQGEVQSIADDTAIIKIGGWRDIWGFLDFESPRTIEVPIEALAFSSPKLIGMRMVLLASENRTAE